MNYRQTNGKASETGYPLNYLVKPRRTKASRARPSSFIFPKKRMAEAMRRVSGQFILSVTHQRRSSNRRRNVLSNQIERTDIFENLGNVCTLASIILVRYALVQAELFIGRQNV